MNFIKMIEAFFGLINTTYGSELEDYIVSGNPQNESDVERLTREYHFTRKYQ